MIDICPFRRADRKRFYPLTGCAYGTAIAPRRSAVDANRDARSASISIAGASTASSRASAPERRLLYWIIAAKVSTVGFLGLQRESRLTSPLVQAKDELVAEPWDAAVKQWPRRSRTCKRKQRSEIDQRRDLKRSLDQRGSVPALKQLVKSLRSDQDRIATLSWSPPGASGDDELLIRANKNPNTRGLAALNDSRLTDQVDSMSPVRSRRATLKMLITLRADIVAARSAKKVRQALPGALDYITGAVN